MQGRLSPLVDGKIQAFPWDHWESEFAEASRLDLGLIEWTLDQHRLYDNPMMTARGQEQIRALAVANSIEIASVTGDFFMQAPFFKARGEERTSRLNDLRRIVQACSDLKIRYLVLPLVDGGRISSAFEEDEVASELEALTPFLEQYGVSIVFESDYPPQELLQFMRRLPSDRFGINYDIGNSAALGFDCVEEIGTYADCIWNVHVKDRIYAGTTVPLGEGDADLAGTIRCLERSGYQGNYILQTARAVNEQHAEVLQRYRSMVMEWLETSQDGT
jgi:hexulose-6-phosphate isomerase